MSDTATAVVRHTPGPWVILGDAVGRGIHGAGSLIAKVFERDQMGVPILETEANASLIAAATDLLEALIQAHSEMSELRALGRYDGLETIDKARVAIAKAKGRDV